MNRTLVWVGLALILACGKQAAPPPDSPHREHIHDPAGPIGHRFEKAEEWVPVFEGTQRDQWQKPDQVVGLLGLTAGMTVADIGAGTGYFLPYLSRAVGGSGKVLGLDIEPDMVRYMKERAQRESLGNVEARVVEVDNPGLAAASVDRILIVNTWHHIPARTEYSSWLRAALTPGGAIFIVDFTMDSPRGPPPEHRLTPEQVISELESAGLDARAIDEQLPDQYVIVGRAR